MPHLELKQETVKESPVSINDSSKMSSSEQLESGDSEIVDEFEEAYGVPLEQAIDLDSWSTGEDLPKLYADLQEQVRRAVEEEEGHQKYIRNVLYPKIAEGPWSVPESGLHCFEVSNLEHAHRGLLFNGKVDACDGTCVSHDTLPITITQIGVCMVSYNGEQGNYVQRYYRKDFPSRKANPEKEILELLERRHHRGSQGQDDTLDEMSQLTRRGFMAYAERAFLLEKSNAPGVWGMAIPLHMS